MADDQPNSNEGADPSDDIKKQNPGETTTSDLAGEGGTSNAGADPNKTENAAKAGRNGMDTDAGQE